MFINFKKALISSITASALFVGSASIMAHADDVTPNTTATTPAAADNSKANDQNTAQDNNQNAAQDSSDQSANTNNDNDDTNTNSDSDDSNVSIKLKTNKKASGYSSLVKEANKHLHTPYVYGATGPTAFDCSGFTRYVFKHSLGKSLPRTAQAQYNAGTKVSAANAKKGDLVFFGGSTGSISHVGIYLGNGKMIDAQNRGVIKESVHASWWHLVGYARVK